MKSQLWLAGILGLMLAREGSAAQGINLVKEQRVIKVSANGRPLFEYQFAPATAFKPYIFQLYSPGGVAVWDGKIDAAQIEQTCQQWQKLAR